MQNSILRVEEVSQRFDYKRARTIQDRFTRSKKESESFWALNDISFELATGKSIALLGANGSGKSTLLKVIGGIYRPTSGHVFRKGRLGALLELGAGFHPELTGRENIYLNGSLLGMRKGSIDLIVDDIVSFSGISPFIDSPVKTYSSGMYVRLGFAVAVHTDPDLLLVDEVLAVGDEAFQNQCLKKVRELQSEGRSIVLVTHSMDTAISFTQQAILLDHGRMEFSGNTDLAADVYHRIVNKQIDVKSSLGFTLNSKLINSNDENRLNHTPSQNVEFTFEVSPIDTLMDLSANVELWTVDGFKVMGSRHPIKWALVNNSLSGIITLRNLVIGNGEYRIALHITNNIDSSIVAVDDCVGFLCVSESRFDSGSIPVEVVVTPNE